MFVAKIDKENNYSFISNKRDNDKIIAKIKTLGDYKIKLDTISPSIKILIFENVAGFFNAEYSCTQPCRREEASPASMRPTASSSYATVLSRALSLPRASKSLP